MICAVRASSCSRHYVNRCPTSCRAGGVLPDSGGVFCRLARTSRPTASVAIDELPTFGQPGASREKAADLEICSRSFSSLSGALQPHVPRCALRPVASCPQSQLAVRTARATVCLTWEAPSIGVRWRPLAELAAEAPVVAAATEEPPGAAGLRPVLSGVHSLRAMLDYSSSPDHEDARSCRRARSGTTMPH
jgi:hypothetical protein